MYYIRVYTTPSNTTTSTTVVTTSILHKSHTTILVVVILLTTLQLIYVTFHDCYIAEHYLCLLYIALLHGLGAAGVTKTI